MGLIGSSTKILAAGNPPKQIAEYVGRLNTQTAALSIACMVSPGGWEEPGQTPEFDEYTIVLRGLVRVTTRTGVTEVKAGQAFIAAAGEWVRYATPDEEGAEYIAICVPAFSPQNVHRDRDRDREVER
jgi:mannose-6-phosphate isomerase-like protein (cupin superfamily)